MLLTAYHTILETKYSRCRQENQIYLRSHKADPNFTKSTYPVAISLVCRKCHHFRKLSHLPEHFETANFPNYQTPVLKYPGNCFFSFSFNIDIFCKQRAQLKGTCTLQTRHCNTRDITYLPTSIEIILFTESPESRDVGCSCSL